jgi:hypothetical protein
LAALLPVAAVLLCSAAHAADLAVQNADPVTRVAGPAAQAADPAAPVAAVSTPPETAVAGGPADRPRVRITDAYIELHTGPGRGFPVFHVAQRGDWIQLRFRHTDWFRVRTDAGKEGWVDRAELATTLSESGGPTSFRDVVLDDYLHRRAEFGGGWGHFSGSSMFKLWGTYNLNDTFAVELTAGQVQGLYSGTSFWQIDIVAEPWADRRLSPFFGIGLGKIDNVPSASLVSAISNNAKLADAMVGVRYHLTQRLIARLDWTEYTAFVSSGRTDQYHALAAGLAFFF